MINVLKKAGIYHPLQRTYRQGIQKVQKFLRKRKYSIYKGSGFLCNICGNSYERFIDDFPSAENREAIARNNVMAGYGKNIICPNCGSTARERLVLLMLDQHFNIAGQKVLHLSPEKYIYNFMKLKADVVTADLHPGFYRHIEAKTQKVNLLRLPFETEVFDLVVGNHILEHIPDDKTAMREIFRVLKTGGRAILQVPYSTSISQTVESPTLLGPKEQSRLFGQKDHVRIYNFDDYIRRLQQAGFKVNFLTAAELEVFAIHAIQEGENFLMIYK